MKQFRKYSLLFLLLLLSFVSNAQCSMCRAVLESETDGGAAEAINDGIMYLMVWPYLLMGAVIFIIYRVIKKDAKSEAS